MTTDISISSFTIKSPSSPCFAYFYPSPYPSPTTELPDACAHIIHLLPFEFRVDRQRENLPGCIFRSFKSWLLTRGALNCRLKMVGDRIMNPRLHPSPFQKVSQPIPISSLDH